MLGTLVASAVASVVAAGAASAQQAPAAAAAPAQKAPSGQFSASSTQLQEVTVTAERRTEQLQNVPMSVIALPAPQLQIQGITSGQGLNAMVPNVSVGNNSPTNQGVTVTIRGIPEVGLYVDGFWQPNLGFRQSGITQVQRVEILRGPQGTLFGRNTNGGAINYITQLPSDKFHIHGAIEFGSYDHRHLEGSVDMPLTPTLLTKWSASIDDQGGWLKSIINEKWYGGHKDDTFRGDVLWKPTDKFSLRVTGTESDIVSDSTRVADFTNVNPSTVNSAWVTLYNVAMMNPAYGPYNFWTGSTEWLSRFNNIGGQWSCKYDGYNCPGGRMGKWETANNEPPLGDRVTTSEYTTTINWNINPEINITNLAAYIRQDQYYNINFFSGPIVGITDLRTTRTNYWSEEFHLSGDLFNKKLSYLFGLYWLHTRTRSHSYRWGATEFFVPQNPTNPIVGPGNEPIQDPTLASFLSAWMTANAGSPLVTDILNNFAFRNSGGQLLIHDFSFGGALKSPSDLNDAVADDTTDDRSIFANATWHALSNLDVQGGVRLAWEGGTSLSRAPVGAYRTFYTNTLGEGGYGPGPLYGNGQVLLTQHPYTTGVVVTPMATASYHFNPQDMVYARYAQGYTSGTKTFNASLGQYITLNPEVVKDYEAGVRTQWLGNKLQANLTLYYMDWDGRPVQTSYFDKATGNFIFVSSSGGKSRADGFEFNLQAVPFEGFRLTADAAYLKTKWITFGQANVGPNTPWSYAPEWTFHLAGQYDYLLPNLADLTLRLDYGYVGSYQINQEIQRQIPGGFPSYGLLNSRIEYSPANSHWDVQLYGTNLTDVAYFTSGYNDGSTWGVAFGELGQRRMEGVRVVYHY